MRPDEHKKKHRAEYKKKHGISNKKTASKETHDTVKDTPNTEAQEKEVLADTDQGDQSQFSRRKVSSNWDRYQDLEDTSDEEGSTTNIQKRGEDFNVLLQRSANPASQFRFQSEKDWDQESDTSTPQVTVSALEVDFGAIAASLNCVPLHKRLDVSADYLHPDLVKEFQLNAEFHRRDQSILPWSSTSKTDTETTTTTTATESRSPLEDTHQPLVLLHNAQNDQKRLIKKTIGQSNSDSKQSPSYSLNSDEDLKPKQSGHAINPSKPQNVEELQTSLKDVYKTVNTVSATSGKGVESANCEEDDELDFLLSLGTPADVTRISSPSGGDHTDKVNLSPDVLSSSGQASNHSANNADDDLEDWLDSVLG